MELFESAIRDVAFEAHHRFATFLGTARGAHVGRQKQLNVVRTMRSISYCVMNR